MTRTLVFETDDGLEVLVTIWIGGTVEVATRHRDSINPFNVWGPPLRLVREETSR